MNDALADYFEMLCQQLHRIYTRWGWFFKFDDQEKWLGWWRYNIGDAQTCYSSRDFSGLKRLDWTIVSWQSLRRKMDGFKLEFSELATPKVHNSGSEFLSSSDSACCFYPKIMFGSLKFHVYFREERRINRKCTKFLRPFRFMVTPELF